MTPYDPIITKPPGKLRVIIAFVLFAIAILLAVASQAANSITLAWNANSETNLAGYRLYWGPASRVYTATQTVLSPPTLVSTTFVPGTNTSTTVTNLPTGKTFYFAVTAYTTDGLESDYSEEVSFGFKPQKPGNLRLTQSTNQTAALWIPTTGKNVQYVEASKDLNTWRPWAKLNVYETNVFDVRSVWVAAMNTDYRFFRLAPELPTVFANPVLPPLPEGTILR